MMTTAEDIARRDAIAGYGVIGRPPEPDLEGLVRLAATVCRTPKAVINIIDDVAQHQIAAVGLEPAVCSREDSMCAVVFREPGHVVVHDAREDERFAENPFVTGEIADVRFYASSPLVTPAGMPIGTLCVFDDVVGELDDDQDAGLQLLAHQVVDVLELRRMTRELGRSNEQLASFAGQVSHDLRNPLTALVGFIELAADSPEMDAAPRAAAALGRAESAAGRMTTMVNELLEYAKLNGSRPRRVPVPLQDLLDAALDDLSAESAATGARVHADTDALLLGDPTLLRVLLQNLIANALKFSSRSTDDPQVVIAATKLDGHYRITVDDNGPGIPEDQRERVFDLMDRGDQTDAPGLGIGLSTARQIVRSHGGIIGIDDAEMGGASIWMLLPAAEH